MVRSSTIRSGKVVVMLLAVGWATTYPAIAEPPNQQRSDAPPPKLDGKLTEGLLDLLVEPEGSKRPAQPATPAKSANDTSSENKRGGNSPTAQPPATSRNPAPATQQSNPLVDVRVAMSTVADMLRARRELDKTRQLQNDIVSRLDELIGTLEDQPAPDQLDQSSRSGERSSSNNETSPRSGQPQNQSTQSGQRAANQQASAESQTNSGRRNREAENAKAMRSNARDDQGGEARDGDSQPGGQAKGQTNSDDDPAAGSSPKSPQKPGDPSEMTGQSTATSIGNRQAVVDLNDPAALQRSAWGNLPERVREQMQSRMVERFLPGYRQQIEAYYRALAK